MRLLAPGSAAALFLLALAAPAAAADHPLDGVWEGAYACGQGKTGLTLTLDATPDGQVTGTFAFWPRSDNPGVPSGRFQVRGTITRDGQLVLKGERWISRPSGYAMVGLRGVARTGVGSEPDALLGDVTDLQGCSQWAVRRKR